jgi:8-oxo-dGTP pyrophosphatase MutT (NUDIX family)/GNAT superfamily N-acetyltransferase
MPGRTTVELVHDLPEGLDALLQESVAEGFGGLQRLQRGWDAGETRFTRPGEVLLAARIDGQLAGLCGLNVDPYLEDASTGRIRHLYVARRRRRTGMAYLLLEAAKAFSHVRVRAGTPAAEAFYDALGFARMAAGDASHAIEPPFLLERRCPLPEGLRDFLGAHVPKTAESVAFGEHVLQLRSYLTEVAPPRDFVLAGRAIVRRGGEVLVCRNRDTQHFVPGGRLEPGETPADAAKRELLEETGWEIADLRPLGFAHLYNPGPVPTGVGRVIHPDFLWQIFRATPVRQRPDFKLADDYEIEAELCAAARVPDAAMRTAFERAFLAATLERSTR